MYEFDREYGDKSVKVKVSNLSQVFFDLFAEVWIKCGCMYVGACL